MIVIVATMKAKEGQEAELEETLRGMVENVQQEEGTVRYTLHRAKNDAGKFMFYEMYKDKAALDYHSTQPSFKESGRKIAKLIEEKTKIDIYEDLASITR
jgi:quinol monooxygenase YgiN